MARTITKTARNVEMQPLKNKKQVQRRPNSVRSSETRAALVEAAIHCLCVLGYSGTTTAEISRYASISTGAMQHHYGTKDELIIACLDQLLLEMVFKLEIFERTEGSRADKCRAFVNIMWHQFYADKRYLAVWEIVVGSRSEKKLHNRVSRHRLKSLQACEDFWCKVFKIENRESDSSIEAMHFALLYMRGAAFNSVIDLRKTNIEQQLKMLESVLISSFE